MSIPHTVGLPNVVQHGIFKQISLLELLYFKCCICEYAALLQATILRLSGLWPISSMKFIMNYKQYMCDCNYM